MKTLILLRHAKSSWDDTVSRDFDRPLNAKGERAAVTMGRTLRSLNLPFDALFASPAVRVEQTLEHFAHGLCRTLAPHWDRRAYLASAATLVDIVREFSDETQTVMLAGHNPGLEELVLTLVPHGADEPLRDLVEQKFPTASVAVIRFDVDRWADVGDGTGHLLHFVRPRDIDPALGPDRD
ncbi:SixA phosphatase family protein [Stakelama pacifica]|uniref:Phosphohistidine phosphatase n=1 Tax=Stakelama pacifica TaxID=517720 RepID=A0A4R6FMT4_9SPHN|nr:histidine phosphatase family protein [Stakelama pacifica]TDN82901.1 phosphohistidine phosphatase [Stakelama pacifica]GGO95254.1 phosphoglycerate mutase [Stakelama pacifica]